MQEFVRAHLGEDLGIERLAQEVAMSARHFARVLLETGTAPLKTIAHRCGFNSAASMRLAFMRHLGVSARQHRPNFGAFAGDATPPAG